VIEQLGVFLFCAVLLSSSYTLCHLAAQWAIRTPRAGYLFLIVFALYVLTRYLP
jgi:hypothetical protein